MKKFTLDLSEYDVMTQVPVIKVEDGKRVPVIKEDGSLELEEKTEPYPLRNNISSWLRGVGVFRSAEDIAEAVSVAKQIRDCAEDELELDECEVKVLKKAINRLVELTAEGKANLGGEVHEEAIIRIVKMKEVKQDV